MIESEHLSRKAWDEVLQTLDRSMDADTYRLIVGRRTTDSARIVVERLGLPLTPAELKRRKDLLWERTWQKGIPARPGLTTLIKALQNRRIPWGVATSSPRPYAIRNLENLGLIDGCQALATGYEVDQGKPAPDIYLLAAERLGETPQRCLALEDSVPGAEAASAAKMRVVAVPNGLTTSRIDFGFVPFVYESLADVAADLEGLLS